MVAHLDFFVMEHVRCLAIPSLVLEVLTKLSFVFVDVDV